MTEKQFEVTVGGLLHDVGKLLYRYNDGRSHAQSGYAFLKEQVGLTQPDILAQVRWHHAADIRKASLPKNSLAYITYLADNIASAADRRKNDGQSGGFVRELPLDSIFNLLRGNDEHKKYSPQMLTEAINYPTGSTIRYKETFYSDCIHQLAACAKEITFTESYLNSLLEILESTMTYLPSSTSLQEVADISLFDHCKLTAALGCCILGYLEDRREEDYHTVLYSAGTEFYAEKAFYLYSVDISGIQSFIYTITGDGALKALRARSFYLDLLMEHLVDQLLAELGLSRANCIYCGGGHAYLLLPNTGAAREQAALFVEETNRWFLENFGTALYLAGGGAECSAQSLKNQPEGSYQEIFKTISSEISAQKLSRYTPATLLRLNTAAQTGERECATCHRVGGWEKSEKCPLCLGLENLSRAVQRKDFFAVTRTRDARAILPLPGGCWLAPESREGLIARMKADEGYRRSYCKNEFYTGKSVATKLWVGDYQNGDSFEALAQGADGIRRLAVLRADVDDLGQAFVSGFASKKYGQRYVTLSRTAIFSRKLALFFKRHMNTLLEEGSYTLTGEPGGRRRATIVYSGGDDLFVIGAWDDILGFAVDLRDALAEYSQNTLTISAGIALYPEKYPVAAMARQTGELEDAAKAYPGKNAVSIFDRENTYSWDAFVNQVLEEKYTIIRDFFSEMPQYGKNFLYNLLELMRASTEKINLARYAYLLARMEPKGAPPERLALYREFSQKMYRWMQEPESCREAITAIYIYVYSIRESEVKEDEA